MKLRIYNKQSIIDNPDLIVFSPTGDYGPFDLIECALKTDPSNTYSQLQAQFVKFGPVVYREKDYIELLKTLGLVDIKPENINDILADSNSTLVIDKNPLETAEQIDSGEIKEAPENKYVELEKSESESTNEKTESAKKDDENIVEDKNESEQNSEDTSIENPQPETPINTSGAPKTNVAEEISETVESVIKNVSTTTEPMVVSEEILNPITKDVITPDATSTEISN